jgi:hypothetical protein
MMSNHKSPIALTMNKTQKQLMQIKVVIGIKLQY